jgi:guanylate kinase
VTRAGIPFVVSAPSGTGKTTVCRRVVAEDGGVEFSVSHTTRALRAGEVHGRDYFFTSRAEFERLVAAGEFVEWAEYAGNLYGTSFSSLDAPLAQGRDLLLEVEVQGARQLRARRRDARFIFLLPPSRAELERRLRTRGTDTPAAIARRLAAVDDELRAVSIFDYAVVNDAIDSAVNAVREIIEAERTGNTASVKRRWARDVTLAAVKSVLPIPT